MNDDYKVTDEQIEILKEMQRLGMKVSGSRIDSDPRIEADANPWLAEHESNTGHGGQSAMNDLKFKVWDKQWNRWFKPIYRAHEGKLEEVLLHPNGHVVLRTMRGLSASDFVQASFEIVRYVGLEDKNGVEIANGDIVMIEHWKSDDLFDYSKPFVVTYEHGQTNFKQDGFNNFIGSFNGEIDIEVIGNIHENPELTEEAVRDS